MVFGSIAALYSRADLAGGLKESGAATAPQARRNLVRSALIAAQVAFSYILLIGAGLMVHSLIQLEQVDPGFVPQKVLAVGFDLKWSSYNKPEKTRSFASACWQSGVSARRVRGRGLIQLSAGSGHFRHERHGSDVPRRRRRAVGCRNAASRIYPRRHSWLFPDARNSAGRWPRFSRSDNEEALSVAVISRSLARRRWGTQDPVGRRITFDNGKNGPPSSAWSAT